MADGASSRAAALIAAAKTRRAKACIVGRSQYAELLEAMAEQGAGAQLIQQIALAELGLQVGRQSIARHLQRDCLCFRGSDYRNRAAART